MLVYSEDGIGQVFLQHTHTHSQMWEEPGDVGGGKGGRNRQKWEEQMEMKGNEYFQINFIT